MSLKDKLQRRRPIQEWPLGKLAAHFTECYAGPAPVMGDRTSVILHHPVKEMTRSEASPGVCEWSVFHMEADSYTAGIVAMGDDPRMIVRGFSRVSTIDDARKEAYEWTEAEQPTPFRFVSKTFQLAVTNFILERTVGLQDLLFLDLLDPADLTDAEREWLSRNEG